MCEMEASMKVRSFFMMDENFLLHKRRALELLDLMKAGHKAWSLYVFSSANAISRSPSSRSSITIWTAASASPPR
jgi:hypothetical protein